MVSPFAPTALFDLEAFEHRALFEGIDHVFRYQCVSNNDGLQMAAQSSFKCRDILGFHLKK